MYSRINLSDCIGYDQTRYGMAGSHDIHYNLNKLTQLDSPKYIQTLSSKFLLL